jgi:hypothetical protein
MKSPDGLLGNFAGLVKQALPASATGKPIEIWFQSLPSGLTRGMKPGSGRKGYWNISGRPSARARGRCGIAATNRFICLAHSVRIADFFLHRDTIADRQTLVLKLNPCRAAGTTGEVPARWKAAARQCDEASARRVSVRSYVR